MNQVELGCGCVVDFSIRSTDPDHWVDMCIPHWIQDAPSAAESVALEEATRNLRAAEWRRMKRSRAS